MPRKIDQVLTKETKERVEKARGKKVYGNYHSEGFYEGNVFCRLCKTPIIEKGKILPNYVIIEFECVGGGRHRSNCCKACAKTLTNEDYEAIYCSDIESWARSADREGTTAEEHESRMGEIQKRELKKDSLRVIDLGRKS